jgi:hypothetical protein
MISHIILFLKKVFKKLLEKRFLNKKYGKIFESVFKVKKKL